MSTITSGRHGRRLRRPKSSKNFNCDKSDHNEKMEDKIIKMFTIPEVKRHIDNDSGLLTMDESEFRIITLLVALAMLLALIATFLFVGIIFGTKEINTIALEFAKGIDD